MPDTVRIHFEIPGLVENLQDDDDFNTAYQDIMASAGDGREPYVDDTFFDVFDFAGQEGLSELFTFEITAASDFSTIPYKHLIGQNAQLTVALLDGTTGDVVEATDDAEDVLLDGDDNPVLRQRTIYGIIAEVHQGGAIVDDQQDTLYFYRFKLVPHLWKLCRTVRSRVFKNMTVKEIINDVVPDDVDVTWDLDEDALYQEREYTVQYKESDLNFISRLMEDEGMFYYFEMEDAATDTLVITDQNPTEGALDIGEVAFGAKINRLSVRMQMMQSKVHVYDHDYEDFPNTNPKSTGYIDPISDGPADDIAQEGFVEEYDERLKSEREGTTHTTDAALESTSALELPEDPDDDDPDTTTRNEEVKALRKQLAARRAQEVRTRQETVLRARSDYEPIGAGRRFTLTDHSRDDLNDRTYLITRVLHAGSQRMTRFSTVSRQDLMLDAYRGPLNKIWRRADRDNQVAYTNSFVGVPNTIGYRPRRRTRKPLVPGVITGQVVNDSADNWVDDEGRYMVQLPFDQSEQADPSRRIRMAQPYSGPDYGIHFPNREGAEAVLAFIDGDIDRPIMLSTVPNPANHTPSPNDKLELPGENTPRGIFGWDMFAAIGLGPSEDKTFTSTKNVIETVRGHRLVMDDADGSDNIGISLQVGQGEFSSTGYDPYWHSRIDMGGYRVKAVTEQLADILDHGLGILGIFSGPIMAYRSAESWKKSAAGIAFMQRAVPMAGVVIASQVLTGDYVSDTFGATAPVGIEGLTDQSVVFQGGSGVELNMPNLLGIWGLIAGYGPDNQRMSQGILSLVRNILHADLVEDIVKGIQKEDDIPEEWEEELEDWAAYEKRKSEENIFALVKSTLGLPAVELNSADAINMTALGKVLVVGGYEGVEVKSNAQIVQKANLDFNIEAQQSILIKTEGKSLGWPGLLDNVDRLFRKHKSVSKGPFAAITAAISALGAKIGLVKSKPDDPVPNPGDCNLTIMNERQDVRLYALQKDILEKAKGNIEMVSLENNITATAPVGDVRLDQGDTEQADKKDYSTLHLVSGEGTPDKSEVRLKSSGDITLSAGNGAATLTLKADGTIELNASKLTLTSSDKLDLLSKNIVLGVSAQVSEFPTVPTKTLSKPVEPAEPEPILPGDQVSEAMAAKLNVSQSAYFARKMEQYGTALAKYEANKAEWDAFDLQRDNFMAAQPPPLATIEMKAPPGEIALDAKGDIKATCLNYAAESKVKYDYKGTLINGEAKGILSTKAALTKIE